MMNRKTRFKDPLSIFFIGVTSVYGLFIITYNVFYPKEISMLENRRLAEFPKLSEVAFWELPGSLTTYLNEHVPFRDDFLEVYKRINSQTFSSLAASAGVAGESELWEYVITEDSLAMRLCPSQKSLKMMDLFVDDLREWDQVIQQRGSEFYCVIIPQKIQVYPEHSENKIVTEFSLSTTGILLQKLADKGIHHLYLRDYLLGLKNPDEPVTYFKGPDHHFSPYGDYRVYQRIMELIRGNQNIYEDVDFMSGAWEHRDAQSEQVLMLTKKSTGITERRVLPDISPGYKQALGRKIYDKYNFWLWYEPQVFKTGREQEPSVAIFGDSFCNPKYISRLPNLLAENFSKTYLFPCYYFIDGMNYLLELPQTEFPDIVLLVMYECQDRLFADPDFYWQKEQ